MLHLKTLCHTRGVHIVPFPLAEVPDSAHYVFWCQVQSLEQSFPCDDDDQLALRYKTVSQQKSVSSLPRDFFIPSLPFEHTVSSLHTPLFKILMLPFEFQNFNITCTSFILKPTAGLQSLFAPVGHPSDGFARDKAGLIPLK